MAYDSVSHPRVPLARFEDDLAEDEDYYAPPVRRDRYSRRPSQGRRTRDIAVTWLSASSGTDNTLSQRNSQPNFSQPNLSNLSQTTLSQPAAHTMASSTPRTHRAMPQPDLYDPPHPPQPIDMPTPVIGRPKTPATPAIGEHMAVPSEFEEEDDPEAMSYIPHRQPPRNRFVGGFIKTLKMLPRLGRWKPTKRPPPGAWNVPSTIPEIHLVTEPDSADQYDEPPVSYSSPSVQPDFDPRSMPEPAIMPVPSVASPRTTASDRADRMRMPEPAVPYPVTQVYSGNMSPVAGTPMSLFGAIPIERSPPGQAPTPAALRHALSMDDDDDIDDRRSFDDGRSQMSFAPPPRTSTPVQHHLHLHHPPRSSPPIHSPRPTHLQPPSEASFTPVIPPQIHVTSPTHSSPSHTHSPPRMHSHSPSHQHQHTLAHYPHTHALIPPQYYDPPSRTETPQNSTFLSHITRFKRFVQDLDNLPFSSDTQIADEYIPSQTQRSKDREQRRGTTIPPSWYGMYDHDHDHHRHHHRHHHSYDLGARVGGYSAVPALDSMPPPLHRPTWGESWDAWAAQSAARLRDMPGPTHQPPLVTPGIPSGVPGMAEMNTGFGPSFPHGYVPQQPVFMYPSAAAYPLAAPGW